MLHVGYHVSIVSVKLQVIRGDRVGEQFPLDSKQLIFGRDLVCDVQICDQGMSRQHFLVHGDQGAYEVQDLDSSNGTYLNGELVANSMVHPGDVITAGETAFRVMLTTTEPSARKSDSTTVRVREADDETQPRFEEKRGSDLETSPVAQTAPEALKALYQLGNAIHSVRDIQELCQIVLREILALLTEAERGCIVLLEGGGVLVPIASECRGDDQNLALSRTILNESVLHGNSTISADAMSDRRYSAEESVNVHGIRAVMCAPLRGREQVLGAIYLDSHARQDLFRPADLDLLTAVGMQAGLAIERTQLELEIRASEARYRNMVEYSPDGIIQTTPRGRIVSCNQAALEIFKTTREELLSWNARQMYYNPQDRERILEIYRHHGSLSNHEVAFKNSLGEKIIVAISSRHVRDDASGEERFEAILRDITHAAHLEEALIKSEERHRTIVEHAPLILCRITVEGNITHLNPFGRRLLGKGESIYQLFPQLKAQLDTLLKRGTSFNVNGHGWKSPSDQLRFLNIQGVSLRDASDNPGGALIIALDVTREKQLSVEIMRQERMASIGLLAAGVAHEFNNIIASMQGYAQLVGRKPEFTVEKLQEVVLLQSGRAKQITDSLMSFSRQKDDSRALTDVRKLLGEAMVLISKELSQNRIKLVTDFQEIPELRINAAQTQQVILNLLMNAVHAMQDGGTLTISTRRHGGYAYIAFCDTGHGIKREDLERIFNPFFTTKGAIGKSKTPGTGLGLSVSYNMIQDHNGEIVVESEPGKGTTFTIMLPLFDSEGTDDPPQETPRLTPADGPPLRILIVEDEPQQQKNLCGMLEQHQLRVAGSGQEAIHLCRREQFDYCLLDIMLPGKMDGFAAFDAIREFDPDIRIFFISAKSQDKRMKEYLTRADGYLSKPFEKDQLLALLTPVN